MTSKITSIYSAFEAFVAANLSSYRRMANGYSLEDNSGLLLNKGWGFAVGPGNDANRYVGCKHSTVRTFTVNLVNQATATDHDLAGHKAQELAILEDAYLLRKAIESDPDLAQTAASATYVEDTGITFLENDRFRFYRIGLNFRVEYHETN